MDIEQAYIDYVCNTPEKRHSLLEVGCASVLPQNECEKLLSDSQPVATPSCCPHDSKTSGGKPGKKNKFLLSFDPLEQKTGASCEEMEREKKKCSNFWDFVDKQPLLAKAIKDGKFLHKSQPKILDECCVIEKKSDEPHGFELMADRIEKMRENRLKEAESMRKRQEARIALQKKSGQLLRKPKAPVPASLSETSFQPAFSDQVPQSPSAEFNEMKEFDSQKLLPAPGETKNRSGEFNAETALEDEEENQEEDNQDSPVACDIDDRINSSSSGLNQVLHIQDFGAPSTLIHLRQADSYNKSEVFSKDRKEYHHGILNVIQPPPPPTRSEEDNRVIHCVSLPISHTVTISEYTF